MYQPPQRIVTKRGANHGLHVVLTILTCGLWAVTGWPIAAILGRRTVVTTTARPYGPPPVYGPPPGAYPPQQQYGPPPQYPQQAPQQPGQQRQPPTWSQPPQ